MMDNVFLQHFRKNGEHRDRSILVVIIPSAVPLKTGVTFAIFQIVGKVCADRQ